MAKVLAAGLEGQIADIRSRSLLSARQGGNYDAMLRLHYLKQALKQLDEQSEPELYRHFPVAAIAILEACFRSFVSSVVDAGGAYLERGLVISKDKLRASIDILAAVHRKTVSLGELVAYGLPFSSVANLEGPICILLDTQFKSLVANAINPHFVRWDVSGDESSTVRPLIVPDVEALFRGLARTFEQRHIFAHEAAPTYTMKFADAQSAIEYVDQACHALDSILWCTAWRDEPLTQTEMNVAAWRKAQAARDRLAVALRLGLAIAKADGVRVRFRTAHAAWKKYVQSWKSWPHKHFERGSIQPLIAALDGEELWSARAQTVETWVSRARPMGPQVEDLGSEQHTG